MELYKVGENIMYSSNGVCLIKDIQNMSFAGGNITRYYILTPFTNSSTVIYVPVENEQLTSKMRHILTKEEIDATLDEVNEKEILWIENRKERMEYFQTIINQGDTTELLRIVACLYKRKLSVVNQGKKFSLTDENLLQQAVSIIDNEFSFVLGVDANKVKDYIQAKVSSNCKKFSSI